MKYIPFTILSILFATAISAQQSPAELVADKIAQKMKDTLQLSSTLKDALHTVNMELHQQKIAARQQYPNDQQAMSQAIQRVEHSRDSLYRMTLQNDTKWLLYKEKKASLVNND
ncbi:MAG: hypothetical protein ABW007_10195 [Chitinophagaceae bacterium]